MDTPSLTAFHIFILQTSRVCMAGLKSQYSYMLVYLFVYGFFLHFKLIFSPCGICL